MELGRRSSDVWLTRRRSMESKPSHRRRRDSIGSQISRQSVEGADRPPPDGDELSLHSDNDDIASTGRKRRQRRSPSPPSRAGVFNNLAHLFGRTGTTEDRRPSISQRSSTSRISRRSRSRDAVSENAVNIEDDEEERWGYSSGEEYSDSESGQSTDMIHDNASITASMQYDSEPSSPHEASQNLPLLNIDPVFGGEARIDMDTAFTLLEPPPPGPPSRQTIYIADEDSTVRFVGYEKITLRVWLWRTCCVLTFGILSLLGHWFPYLWLRCVAREKAFKDSHNGFLVVEVSHQISSRCPVLYLTVSI